MSTVTIIKDGKEKVVPQAEYDASNAPVVITRSDVNAERDRRIAETFIFNSTPFDFDPASKQRVTGAATLAGFAIGNGAQVGDFHWHGNPSVEFSWIGADNTLVKMDAQTCFAFGQSAAAHETAHILAARALKDMASIPSNYTDEQYWP